MTAGLLGPVTDTDLRGWQLRAHTVLGEVLKIGCEQELNILTWRVSQFGLVGEYIGDCAPRRVFAAWAAALGLARMEELTTRRVRLHAAAKNWQGKRVDVAVIVTVWPEDEEQV